MEKKRIINNLSYDLWAPQDEINDPEASTLWIWKTEITSEWKIHFSLGQTGLFIPSRARKDYELSTSPETGEIQRWIDKRLNKIPEVLTRFAFWNFIIISDFNTSPTIEDLRNTPENFSVLLSINNLTLNGALVAPTWWLYWKSINKFKYNEVEKKWWFLWWQINWFSKEAQQIEWIDNDIITVWKTHIKNVSLYYDSKTWTMEWIRTVHTTKNKVLQALKSYKSNIENHTPGKAARLFVNINLADLLKIWTSQKGSKILLRSEKHKMELYSGLTWEQIKNVSDYNTYNKAQKKFIAEKWLSNSTPILEINFDWEWNAYIRPEVCWNIWWTLNNIIWNQEDSTSALWVWPTTEEKIVFLWSRFERLIKNDLWLDMDEYTIKVWEKTITPDLIKDVNSEKILFDFKVSSKAKLSTNYSNFKWKRYTVYLYNPKEDEYPWNWKLSVEEFYSLIWEDLSSEMKEKIEALRRERKKLWELLIEEKNLTNEETVRKIIQ